MFITADAHIMEPTDLFTSRLPEEDHFRAPTYNRLPGGRKMWTSNGVRTSLTPDYWRDLPDGTKQVIAPSDADGYLADLDLDGVWGAVMHGNVGLAIYDLDDPDFALRCAQIYNDWGAETYNGSTRLYPMPIIPLIDIDNALGEIERVAKLGFRGLEVPMSAPAAAPYFSRHYDPIWAAAQKHGLPVFAHIGTGVKRSTAGLDLVQRTVSFTAPREAADWPAGHPDHEAALVANKMSFGPLGGFTGSTAGEMIPALIAGGVAERFPDVHFLMVEVGARWLQNLMDTMDDTWYDGPGVVEVNRTFFRSDGSTFQQFEDDAMNLHWPYPQMPSDYVRRQFHVTFMDDWRALRNRAVTGVRPLIWGNDYPHFEGSWPKSVEAIDVQSEKAGLTADEKSAIFGGTLANLLGIESVVPATHA
jgi:predicted TIM-barrel fold metal-dependent hydrolase